MLRKCKHIEAGLLFILVVSLFLVTSCTKKIDTAKAQDVASKVSIAMFRYNAKGSNNNTDIKQLVTDSLYTKRFNMSDNNVINNYYKSDMPFKTTATVEKISIPENLASGAEIIVVLKVHSQYLDSNGNVLKDTDSKSGFEYSYSTVSFEIGDNYKVYAINNYANTSRTIQ